MAPSKAGKAADPAAKRKLVFAVVGLVLLLGGCVGFYLGLKPLAPLTELFGGGPPSAEGQEFLDNLDQHLADAAVPVGLGFVGLMAGIVFLKLGLAPPKPKSVEELVAQEVERRLAQAPMSSPGATVSAIPVPSQPVWAPPPGPTRPSSPAAVRAPPRPGAPAVPTARPAAPTHASPAAAPRPAPASSAVCSWCSSPVAAGTKRCGVCGNRP